MITFFPVDNLDMTLIKLTDKPTFLGSTISTFVNRLRMGDSNVNLVRTQIKDAETRRSVSKGIY